VKAGVVVHRLPQPTYHRHGACVVPDTVLRRDLHHRGRLCRVEDLGYREPLPGLVLGRRLYLVLRQEGEVGT
jgi:hypothetical protein